MADAPYSRRRILQFRLSTVLVAVTLVAVTAAWFSAQWHTVRERQHMRGEIWEQGGSVYTTGDLAIRGDVSSLRRWLGDEAVGTIYLPPPRFDAKDFAEVRAAFPEAYVFPPMPLTVDRER